MGRPFIQSSFHSFIHSTKTFFEHYYVSGTTQASRDTDIRRHSFSPHRAGILLRETGKNKKTKAKCIAHFQVVISAILKKQGKR